MTWITGSGNMMFCTVHDTEFAKPRSCPQCPGPGRLNRRDDDGAPVDPFPELTEALGPEIDGMTEFIAFARQREGEAFASGLATAAVGYGRLALTAITERAKFRILLADWKRVRALEERRKWSRMSPADMPALPPAAEVQ